MNTNAQNGEDLPLNPANRREYLNIEFVRAHSRRSLQPVFVFIFYFQRSCFEIQNSGSLRPSGFVIIDLLRTAG